MQKIFFFVQESFRYSVRKQEGFFCVFKNVLQKNVFVYEWELQWPLASKDNAHVFICIKSKTNCKTSVFTKSMTVFKKLDNFRYVFIHKKTYTLRYRIFHEYLKLAFIYKKHNTLRYVTLLYTKIYFTFRDILILKKLCTLRNVICVTF